MPRISGHTLPVRADCCYRGAGGRPATKIDLPGGDLMPAFISRCLVAASLAGLAWPGSAYALDQLRFGKAVPNSFAFGAAEVGVQARIYEQEGIDLQVLTFQGDARIQQALTADGIDVA